MQTNTENLINDLLEKKDYSKLKKALLNVEAVDIAELLEEQESILIIFRLLNKNTAAEVFSYLSPDKQEVIVNSINDSALKGILDELFFDDMIDFIEEMPAIVVKRVLENSSENNRILINQFLSYEDDTAGSLMTIEYISIKKEITVKEAINYIRSRGRESETIDSIYVIDEKRKLEGTLHLRQLLFANDNEIIKDIMDTEILSVTTSANQEEAIELFKKYDLLVLPVVDTEQKLVGIITIDDVVDAIEDENTEDFQKMSALIPSKDEYLDSSVFDLAKNRLLWLLVLMISATFTGTIISKYENILQSMVILVSSIPMLMDTGGNAGSQSSTLVIRGMALGEIESSDIFKIIWKELRVSGLVGLGLGLVNFVRMVYILKVDFTVSIVVSLTLFLTVVIAKLVGGVLPIGAKWLKLDPAIMAGPLVTTIVDTLALFVYFFLARVMLNI